MLFPNFKRTHKRIGFYFALLSLALMLSLPAFSSAAFNKEINYQGKLADGSGTIVDDGDYNMEFKLYVDSSTTTALWTETRDGGDKVAVINGLFSVMLGEVTALDGIDFNQTLYLGVNIGGTSTPSWDGEMTPRKRLGAVPAAIEAENLGGASSTQYLRSDQPGTLAVSSASTALTITQSGAGNILDLKDGATTVFTVLDGGNVGIGTTTPQQLLHVSKNQNAVTYTQIENVNTGSSAQAGLKTSGDSGNFYFGVGSAAGTFGGGGFAYTDGNIPYTVWTNNAKRLTVAGDGKVTVGPTAGTITALNSFSASTTDNFQLAVGYSDSFYWKLGRENAVTGRFDIADESGTKLTILNSGNVGIGTTTPSQKLNVYGGLMVSTSSTPLFLANTATNNVGIRTSSATYPLQVRDNSTISAYTTSGPAALLMSQTSNGGSSPSAVEPILVLGREGVLGQAFPNFAQIGLRRSRVSGFDANTALDFAVNHTQGMAGTSMVLLSSVATTSINTEPVFQIASPLNTGLSWPQAATFKIGRYQAASSFSPDTRLDIALKTSLSGDLTADVTVMTLQGDGKVGIGTTTPSAKLSVTGTAGTGDIFALASSTEARLFTVTSSGNVGVGSSTPISKLSVVGTAGSSDVFVVASSTNAQFLTIKSTGNVGIGNQTPGRMLDIGGDASINGQLVSNQEGGLYFGRSKVSESQLGLNASSTGASFVQRAGFSLWISLAMSSDGKYQTALDQSIGIATSRDYGVTWTTKATTSSWYDVAMSSDGKYQTATIGNGLIYTSSDYGVTWTARDTTRFWRDVAMSSDGKYQSAGISSGQVYNSSDYGVTWTAGASGIADSGMAMSSDGKYRTTAMSSGNIYTSSDYGATWTARDSARGWGDFAMSSDGKYQTATAGSNDYLYRSTDYGVTWTAVDSLRNWNPIAMSSDGKYQVSGEASSGYVYTSNDYGLTWVRGGVSSGGWRSAAISSDGKYITVAQYVGYIFTSTLDSYIAGGKLGLGTTTPTALLSLQGTAGTSTILDIASSTGASLLRLTSAGNLGIGTTTPANKLDVIGNARIEGSLIVPDGGNEALDSYNIRLGDSGVSLFASNGGDAGTNAGLFADYLGGITYVAAFNDVTGRYSYGGGNIFTEEARTSIGANGSAVGSSTLNVYGGVSIGSNTYVQKLAPTSGLIVEGNVGIGTTTPGKKLVVAGDIDFTGSLYQNGTLYSPTAAPTVKSASSSATTAITVTEASVVSVDITPSGTGAEIQLWGSASFDSTSGSDNTTSLRIRRGACTTGTQVGVPFTGFTTNATEYINLSSSGLDAPASSTAVTYHVCVVANGSFGNVIGASIAAMEVQEGADLAEVYNTNETDLEAGHIVSLDATLVAGVKKSTKAYDEQMFGVVSTRPALLIGGGDRAGVTSVPVALSGRVPVKVSLENGPILPGDKLTSSSKPGVAMKATRSGRVVAISMGAFDSSNEDDQGIVTAFISTGSHIEENSLLASNAITFLPDTATTSTSTGKLALNAKVETSSGRYDIAEDYGTHDEELVAGEVVSLDAENPLYVVRSRGKNDKNIIGVYSTNPALRFSQKAGELGDTVVPVTLSGRTEVKVGLDNGPIEVGDYLSASSERGRAVKAIKPGRVIGRALSAYDGEGDKDTVIISVRIETIDKGDLKKAEEEADEIMGERARLTLLELIGESISSLARALIEQVNNVATFVANQATFLVASVGELFTKTIVILPGGSLVVAHGDNEIAGSGAIPAGSKKVFIMHTAVKKDSVISLTATSLTEAPLFVSRIVEGEGFEVNVAREQDNEVRFNWIMIQTYGREMESEVEDEVATSTVEIELDDPKPLPNSNPTTVDDIEVREEIEVPVEENSPEPGEESSGSSGGGGGGGGGSTVVPEPEVVETEKETTEEETVPADEEETVTEAEPVSEPEAEVESEPEPELEPAEESEPEESPSGPAESSGESSSQ